VGHPPPPGADPPPGGPAETCSGLANVHAASPAVRRCTGVASPHCMWSRQLMLLAELLLVDVCQAKHL
jgi:hypothetical protein